MQAKKSKKGKKIRLAGTRDWKKSEKGQKQTNDGPKIKPHHDQKHARARPHPDSNQPPILPSRKHLDTLRLNGEEKKL